MQIELKQFQSDAVKKILDHIESATNLWITKKQYSALSLLSMTGSGKTVIAAAVIDALFHGSDEYGFHLEKEPVVLWFSDLPSLNKQTLSRLYETLGKSSLAMDRLRIIHHSNFDQPKFDARTVYFLNTQKIGQAGILSGARRSKSVDFVEESDNRNTTIWDTIANTINDEDLVLYFILDEAHRGMIKGGITNGKRKTIVKRLIEGYKNEFVSVPPMPIVWGISATDRRFKEAMSDKRNLFPVTIDPEEVQESGLVKSYVRIDFPDEPGEGAASLYVKHGAEKFSKACDLWEEYCTSESMPTESTVRPLMILQIPNTPDSDDVGRWIDIVIRECRGRIDLGNVSNVLEGGRTQYYGEYEVPYVNPEDVQECKHTRLLIAKQSITTGWDCPRAEVLVSLRPASDDVYITQLIGRMMRAPLALPIRDDVRLNGIDCVLPHFNHNTVDGVVAMLTGKDIENVGSVKCVLENPVEMIQNPKIDASVWNKFESIKTYSVPRRSKDPMRRLNKFAQLLAQSDIVERAGRIASRRLIDLLLGILDDQKDEFKKERTRVLNIGMKSVKTPIFDSDSKILKDIKVLADEDTIHKSFEVAARSLNRDLAKNFVNHMVKKDRKGESRDKILRARVNFTALSRLPDTYSKVVDEANRIIDDWFSDNNISVQIGRLSVSKRESFRQIRETGSKPTSELLKAVPSFPHCDSVRDENGVTALDTYPKHLYCDKYGLFPEQLNQFEQEVLKQEINRPGIVGWYRNGSGVTAPSLGIVYEEAGPGSNLRILRPDFIFFSKNSDDEVIAEIVDPHGSHLDDFLPKLRGLANYAAKHGRIFARVQSITEIGGRKRCIDLCDQKSRKIVRKAKSLSEVFESDEARDYG